VRNLIFLLLILHSFRSKINVICPV
jgi:hypothetical protein